MKRLKRLILVLATAFLWLGSSDTACAQQNTLVIGPQALTFNVPAGSISNTQQVSVSTTGAATSFVVQASQGANWLVFSPQVGNTPSTILVSVNASGLSMSTYMATLTITAQGLAGSPATVNVTANVGGGASQLFVSPTQLAFGAQVGGQAPPPQSVSVSSSSGAVTFTGAGTTTDGGNWLLFNPTSGTTTATINVGVNPAGLVAGTYTGMLTFSSSAGNASVSITLTVSSNPTLTVSPPTLQTFYYQVGSSVPAAQSLTLGSTGAALGFSVSTAGGNWLVVSPLAGATPAVLTVSVNVSGLFPGPYNGTITISAPGAANPTVQIQVALVVSNSPLLTLSASTLNFSAQLNGTAPPSQTVNVGSTGTPLSINAAAAATGGGSWLMVGPQGGTTPVTLTISINQTGLSIGNYTGTVTVSAQGASNSPQTIQVNLTVAAGVQMNAVPGLLVFNFQTSQNPPSSQQVQLTSTGPPLSFTVTATTSSCGSNWLGVTPAGGTTSASITVSVNPTGLSPGTCGGQVSVISNAGNSPVNIPVTFNISNNPLLNVSPAFFSETVPQGSGQFTRTIALTSTNPNASLSFTAIASTNSGGNWLLVGPNSGSTAANVTLFILPVDLPAGAYTGQITITSPGLPSPQNVPVTLTITSNVTVTVNPTSLSFQQPQGGPAPDAQSVQVTASSGSLSFTATASTNAGGNWLNVSPQIGTTGSALTVTANGAGLSQGTYTGQITLAIPGAANSQITIGVTLTIGPPQSVLATPASLAFSYQVGATNPAAQNISVVSTGGPVGFSVSVLTINGGAWLSVSPTRGTTPQNLIVTVNTTGLAVATYLGSISISAPGVLAQPIVINVTFTVTAAPPPSLTIVTNSASNVAGSIGPGEILAIKGLLLGPPVEVRFALNAQGGLDPILGGVRVLFDNIAGSPLFVRADQINVIAPYEIAGRVLVPIVVEYNGVQSAPIIVRVADAAPAIFTTNFTGQGQGAILNQDNSRNELIAARPDTVVQVFGTGDGQTDPPSRTGTVTGLVLNRTRLRPVNATVGGRPAVVDFSGAAPVAVAGLWQANVRLPADLPPGNHEIVIFVGGIATPGGVTVQVGPR